MSEMDKPVGSGMYGEYAPIMVGAGTALKTSAPSDGLREALTLLMQTPFEPSLAYQVKLVCEAVGKKLDADDAALSASSAQGEKS